MNFDEIDPFAAARIEATADALEAVGIDPLDLAGALISEGAARLMIEMGVDDAHKILRGWADKTKADRHG